VSDDQLRRTLLGDEITRLRRDQARVVQPDRLIVRLLGHIDALRAERDRLAVALAERNEQAGALANAVVSRTSPPGTTTWQSECLICTYHWYDGAPERHSTACPAGSIRALVGRTGEGSTP